jgi:hypothetical protein
LCWLPDIARWAQIVALFLRPGGTLYLADGHPAAYVLDDREKLPGGLPGFFVSYFSREPLILEQESDYADETARLVHATTHEWVHPLGETVSALIAAGLSLDWLHEHDAVPWRMFEMLRRDPDRLYRWPDKSWLPLAFSLQATRR